MIEDILFRSNSSVEGVIQISKFGFQIFDRNAGMAVSCVFPNKSRYKHEIEQYLNKRVLISGTAYSTSEKISFIVIESIDEIQENDLPSVEEIKGILTRQ